MHTQKKLVLLIGIALALSILFSVAAMIVNAERDRSEGALASKLYIEVVSKLHIGMSEDEVNAITKQAAISYRCPGDNSWEEVHLFGSKRPELAGILYLRLERVGSNTVVTQFGNLEYDQLPTFEKRCNQVIR